MSRDLHQYLYPVFQFSESPEQGEQGVLATFGEILGLLGDRPAWEKVQFFLTASPLLAGRTPLAALRRGTPDAVARVRQLAQHAGQMGS